MNRGRVADIHRQLAALHAELAEEYARDPGDDWIDQHHSPLGKRRHLDLVRAQVLPGYKPDHNHVFVRRADLDAYIASSKVSPKRKLAPRAKPIKDADRDPQRAAARFGSKVGLVRVR